MSLVKIFIYPRNCIFSSFTFYLFLYSKFVKAFVDSYIQASKMMDYIWEAGRNGGFFYLNSLIRNRVYCVLCHPSDFRYSITILILSSSCILSPLSLSSYFILTHLHNIFSACIPYFSIFYPIFDFHNQPITLHISLSSFLFTIINDASHLIRIRAYSSS